ncbi:Hsp33 family molecular chaperone HslO [Pelomonas sp. SE-A7]|uniref:Hsp33 family molecular chaperone HslO n=1 Tax=Pelomonas sp. SE-A7 TaxID=3054953 RepID=UPI00259D0B0F|nr:Hsp33 family molecular chaperone HslO [Pelomonas sp. SE-A7]MDM4765370.1 Hsp33 family molecular chaperone HslO [Pelomonas sp. SE-A7]
MTDELHKFLFEGLPVRGLLVRLHDSWREVLKRREASGAFPPEVRQLLGEMAAGSVLMQANIKFNGSLVMQMMGDGPVKLIVAEARQDLSFRATAKVVGHVPAGADLQRLLNVHGQGRCAITLDPLDKLPGQQPYQGVVSLHGQEHEPLQTLADVLGNYMLQSEQLDTKLVLAANDEVAAGLLIQHLPIQGEGNLEGRSQATAEDIADAFNRMATLASSLKADELLNLDADTLLRRLYWQEQLQRFTPQTPRFACSCSRERVGGMLRGLGREEIDQVLAERGEVEVGCDFCGLQYRYDAVDVGALFTEKAAQAGGSSTVQ